MTTGAWYVYIKEVGLTPQFDFVARTSSRDDAERVAAVLRQRLQAQRPQIEIEWISSRAAKRHALDEKIKENLERGRRLEPAREAFAARIAADLLTPSMPEAGAIGLVPTPQCDLPAIPSGASPWYIYVQEFGMMDPFNFVARTSNRDDAERVAEVLRQRLAPQPDFFGRIGIERIAKRMAKRHALDEKIVQNLERGRQGEPEIAAFAARIAAELLARPASSPDASKNSPISPTMQSSSEAVLQPSSAWYAFLREEAFHLKLLEGEDPDEPRVTIWPVAKADSEPDVRRIEAWLDKWIIGIKSETLTCYVKQIDQIKARSQALDDLIVLYQSSGRSGGNSELDEAIRWIDKLFARDRTDQSGSVIPVTISDSKANAPSETPAVEPEPPNQPRPPDDGDFDPAHLPTIGDPSMASGLTNTKPATEASVSRSGADESAGPVLTASQSRVLQAMARFDASQLLSAAKITAETADPSAQPPLPPLNPETVRQCVGKLINSKLAERPEGDRSGARLTTAGRRLAGKIAD